MLCQSVYSLTLSVNNVQVVPFLKSDHLLLLLLLFLLPVLLLSGVQIEILTYCQLTCRQRLLYQALRNKISIEDLLQSSMGTAQQSHNTTSSLMNLVMQFRKVAPPPPPHRLRILPPKQPPPLPQPKG